MPFPCIIFTNRLRAVSQVFKLALPCRCSHEINNETALAAACVVELNGFSSLEIYTFDSDPDLVSSDNTMSGVAKFSGEIIEANAQFLLSAERCLM